VDLDRHDLDGAVHRADLDELVRLVDSLTAAQAWAPLLTLRDRARAAVAATGRQLWPVATLAEYRLALWAPARWAAAVLEEDSGRFTIGPLTEVVTQRHTFAELAGHLGQGPRRGFVAHEAALRGEAIDSDEANPLEIPFAVQDWEPAYALATYGDDGIDAPSPPVPQRGGTSVGPPGQLVEDDGVTLAVRQLLDSWTAQSDGQVEVACVEGDAGAAVAALGVPGATLVPITADEAMAWLAWAGASGGANGRRRGAAIGRFGAWWLLAALGDLLDEWPVPPGELGRLARALDWGWWDAGEPAAGWELQLAVADPAEGYGWAISARDAAS
jgi:hypothetical protein